MGVFRNFVEPLLIEVDCIHSPKMPAEALHADFANVWDIQFSDSRYEGGNTTRLFLAVVISDPAAQCPNCQQWSQSIHSRYVRHLADLPWGGVPVQID